MFKQQQPKELQENLQSDLEDIQTHKINTNKKQQNNKAVIIKGRQYISNGISESEFNVINTQTPKKSESDGVSTSTKYPPTSGHAISSSKNIQITNIFGQVKRFEPISYIQSLSQRQINYLIHYIGNFDYIRDKFIELAFKKKLNIMRNHDNSVIVKRVQSFSYKCIINMCFPVGEDIAVYELKNYTNRKNKAKLILISGDQQTFQQFREQLCVQLWLQKAIILNQSQAIEHFYYLNRPSFQFLSKQCQNEQNKKNIKLKTLKNLLKIIKKRQISLKKQLTQFQQININPSAQKKLQQIIYKNIKIWQIYQKYYQSQILELQNQKIKILKNNSLIDIFNYLEISIKLKQTNQSFILIQRQKLPYYPSIQILQKFTYQCSPGSIIQMISIFSYKLRTCYNQFLQDFKVLDIDMDNLLPLIIYCVLLAQNYKLIPICKMMLEYLEDQENYQPQKKIITSLEAAMDYIRMEWKTQIKS